MRIIVSTTLGDEFNIEVENTTTVDCLKKILSSLIFSGKGAESVVKSPLFLSFHGKALEEGGQQLGSLGVKDNSRFLCDLKVLHVMALEPERSQPPQGPKTTPADGAKETVKTTKAEPKPKANPRESPEQLIPVDPSDPLTMPFPGGKPGDPGFLSTVDHAMSIQISQKEEPVDKNKYINAEDPVLPDGVTLDNVLHLVGFGIKRDEAIQLLVKHKNDLERVIRALWG